ncbi:MAG: phosphoenolpyruvate--protein phosphotransferase [Deltaproteobacteria bacterium]|jgi:phosphocarrier protein FPr|nr:phosphoenolpyruvate--protein phosphotransferase [Deltaproteobacteria bacterium]
MTSAHPKQSLNLLAPVTGLITPIEKVPDPTFAQKMVGDGVAIDPASERLVSPCDGKVTQLHSAGHALTVTTKGGLEVLMHIGLETVNLKGKGFKPQVSQGQEVKTGDPLIDFDADYIIHNASSLITILVITNTELASGFLPGSGFAEAGKTEVLEVLLKEAPTETKASTDFALSSDPIVILNPSGLHARPSAVLVNHAKQYKSNITIQKEDGTKGNAKSVVSLMGLEIKSHDRVIIHAEGEDAKEAIETLAPLLASGLGENIHGVPSQEPQLKPEKKVSEDPNVLLGVSASPGQAIGKIFQLRYQEIAVVKKGKGPEEENKQLKEAIIAAREELKELQQSMRLKAEAGKAAIFSAHEELLEDPALLSDATNGINAGESAAYAWQKAFSAQADKLSKLNNELLAGRANDVRDIGRRVLSRLTGASTAKPDLPDSAILVAEDLTPSDTASLDRSKVQGFAITGGSATSHASILARAASIPAIAAIEDRALDIPTGTPAVLDGDKGELRLNPSAEEVTAIKELQKKSHEQRKMELADAQMSSQTTDDHRVKVVGNIGGLSEAEEIPPLGGEGVGLLRSEFLFLQRSVAPDETEQAAVYTSIAKVLGPDRDLVVRTLDVGGDKPLAYMPLPEEMNPFLGIRGIRLNQLGTDLFKSQIRAILSAAPFTKLHIMFPMVTTADELKEAKSLVLAEKEALGITQDVKIGIMVEVPAAALTSDILAKEADFFSIGTNDLTQYTLAIDRGHPRLAKMADALHPAVLRLIDRTVKAAHDNGRWVGVCGGIAGDTQAGPVLIGLGVDELSVSGGSIPTIKAMVRRQSFSECQEIAQKALQMATSTEVRQFLAQITSQHDLRRVNINKT